jgi:hypothetical protein
MGECCGGWWWGVTLTGAADPPMVLTLDEGETWKLGAPSFSTNVYATLFDAVFFDPVACAHEVHLEGQHLEGATRLRLQEQFRIEPTTRVPYPFSSHLTDRYSREGQRVNVANLEVPTGLQTRPDSRWRLWAADEDGFHDLVRRLRNVVPALASVTYEKNSSLVRLDLPSPDDSSDIPF